MTAMNNHSGTIIEHSGFELPIIATINTRTGEPLSTERFADVCSDFLVIQAHIQQRLINENALTLPERESTAFGTQWARDNVNVPPDVQIPSTYIEKYWTLTIDKIEAARLLLAYRQRLRIYDIIQELGDDATIQNVRDKAGKYVDWRLIKNIQAMKGPPSIPKVRHPRFPTNQTNNVFCQMRTYDDVIHLHNIAIGENRYDIIFDAARVLQRYPNLSKVNRPTLRLGKDGNVHCDFSVAECVKREPVTTDSVVAFDRNMDHDHCVTGIRVHANGTIGKELGPSLQTMTAIHHARKVNVELDRCERKLANLMPWDDSGHRARLESQVKALSDRLDTLREEIDWSEANDILCHANPGEAIGVEQLDMFGGGFVKFRHGSTDAKLEHACAREGRSLVHVNPAGSSSSCPVCGARLRRVRGTDIEACPSCGHEQYHDHGAAVVLAGRTMGRVRDDWDENAVIVPESSVLVERSRCKRERRERKMRSRAVRGCRTYRVKGKPSPSRPGASRSRSGLVVACVPRDGAGLVSLRDLVGRALSEKLNKEVCSSDCAGRADGVLTFGAWAVTNVVVGGAGIMTCYAYVAGLLKKWFDSREKNSQTIANTAI